MQVWVYLLLSSQQQLDSNLTACKKKKEEEQTKTSVQLLAQTLKETDVDILAEFQSTIIITVAQTNKQ